MKTKMVIACVAWLLLAGISSAADKPNFSGHWTLDKDKSFSNPPGLEQTLAVTHQGDKLTMETKVKTAASANEINITETYTLDGQEVDFTPQAPPNSKGRRKASWLPGGSGILVSDSVTLEGKAVNQTSRKWTLSSDGKMLRIDYFYDMERGTFEGKRVFNKVP
jgi:hypothetical protein